jgi:polyprenyl-phospho-N-acetylgalactosaminyl synthase
VQAEVTTGAPSTDAAPTLAPPGTWVVIPAYNEARVIHDVVAEVLNKGVRVVVVDDCSRDGTGEALADMPCAVLRHRVNLGQGAALQTGVEYAARNGALYVVTFDADGQHDPEDIPKMVAPLAAGQADVTLGSRFLGKAVDMTARRRLLLKAAIAFTRVTVGLKLTDVHNGLRGFKRDVLPKLVIRQNRMAHASEILALIKDAGVAYQEVPSTVRYSEYSKAKGQSALGAADIIYELVTKRLLP